MQPPSRVPPMRYCAGWLWDLWNDGSFAWFNRVRTARGAKWRRNHTEVGWKLVRAVCDLNLSEYLSGCLKPKRGSSSFKGSYHDLGFDWDSVGWALNPHNHTCEVYGPIRYLDRSSLVTYFAANPGWRVFNSCPRAQVLMIVSTVAPQLAGRLCPFYDMASSGLAIFHSSSKRSRRIEQVVFSGRQVGTAFIFWIREDSPTCGSGVERKNALDGGALRSGVTDVN